jgi:ribosomal RNA-processing protein 12
LLVVFRFIIPDDQDDAMDSDESEDEETIKTDVAAQLERMGLHNQAAKSDGAATPRKRGRDDDGDAGKEFRAKKAGGDVKKKGKFEPYAYIPLDPKLMAKRNKRSAVNKYKSNVGKRKNK